MQRASKPSIGEWLLLAGVLLLLNQALTFYNVWPTPWVRWSKHYSVDLVVLLAGLVALGTFVRPLPRWFRTSLTVLLVALCIGRYADVTAPALYGRPVNFYWDAQHLPAVGAMLAKVAPPWLVTVFVLALVALLAAMFAVFHWSVGRLARALEVREMRLALGVLSVGLVVAYAGGHLLQWRSLRWFALPVASTYWQQGRFLVEAHLASKGGDLPIKPLEPSNLARVAGADVLLMFLESYGATSYDRPAIANVVNPQREALQEAAAATGRRVVSAYVTSPTFGGASWLAHATLMSEHEVRDVGQYGLLLTQKRETLPTLFTRAGYRSIAWMPGLKNPWPEGGYYGFASIYGEREIGYRGPDFGWWRIPDQFALAKLDAAELDLEPRAPVFVFFPTINTHVPFRPTPPYQPDWTRLLSEDPFDAKAAAASVAEEPDWTNLAPAYADSLAYTFEYLAGYLRARPGSDFVLLLVGDHQPAASVSGVGARWDVPVHVITTRNEVADALRQMGFVEGMRLAPAQQPIGAMVELTAMFLRAFDSGADRTHPGG